MIRSRATLAFSAAFVTFLVTVIVQVLQLPVRRIWGLSDRHLISFRDHISEGGFGAWGIASVAVGLLVITGVIALSVDLTVERAQRIRGLSGVVWTATWCSLIYLLSHLLVEPSPSLYGVVPCIESRRRLMMRYRTRLIGRRDGAWWEERLELTFEARAWGRPAGDEVVLAEFSGESDEGDTIAPLSRRSVPRLGLGDELMINDSPVAGQVRGIPRGNPVASAPPLDEARFWELLQPEPGHPVMLRRMAVLRDRLERVDDAVALAFYSRFVSQIRDVARASDQVNPSAAASVLMCGKDAWEAARSTPRELHGPTLLRLEDLASVAEQAIDRPILLPGFGSASLRQRDLRDLESMEPMLRERGHHSDAVSAWLCQGDLLGSLLTFRAIVDEGAGRAEYVVAAAYRPRVGVARLVDRVSAWLGSRGELVSAIEAADPESAATFPRMSAVHRLRRPRRLEDDETLRRLAPQQR